MSAAGGLATPMTDTDRMEASDGTTITIGEDGEVYFDAKPPAVIRKPDKDNFGENLAETLPEGTLNDIANDYLDGVNADILSRQEFIQNLNKGVDLLGLKLEEASSARGNRQSISRIRNPSLLKACTRSQSMSRGQLLPAAGPAKVQTISGENQEEDQLARDFGQDFNYFLTHVDRSYYTDTDRMLFYRAFGGSAFKKIYRDPILKRPTSRFVPLENLIVSEDATDLHDALRKTNELLYNPIQVQRMQAVGVWLDIELGQPMQNISPARRKILESQGLSAATTRSQDISHTIYEGYWHIGGRDYGLDDPLADPNMPAPYTLVMDRDSRKVLSLRRNWKKDDEMFRERQCFVKYGLVPGLGFLDYGFLHLIGNQTRVLTAIWQIMVDKGMLANFPGGLKVKGVRAATNELNPGLGEWAEVDIGSMKSIKDALMGMPYGDVTDSLIKLAEMLQKDISAQSGDLDIPTGQGTTNTPVGTILAMIEQQAQDLTAVQQRDHRAQEEELRLLRDLFVENPEDLKHLQRRGSKRNWGELVEEFTNMDLVPVSDPNIPSQAHRILINQFLVSIVEKAPYLFGVAGQRKAALRVLTGVGINDADDLLAPLPEIAKNIEAMGKKKGGDGGAAAAALKQMELPLKAAEIEVKKEKLANDKIDTQRKAAQESAQETNDQKKTEAEIRQTDARIALEGAELQHDQQALAHEMASESGDGAEPNADVERALTVAKTMAAVGSGTLSLVKAGQQAGDGRTDLEDFQTGKKRTRAKLPAPKPAATKGGLQGAKSKPTKAAGKKKG